MKRDQLIAICRRIIQNPTNWRYSDTHGLFFKCARCDEWHPVTELGEKHHA